MSYTDRLRPCKYISPSGKSFTLLYEEVEKQAEKKSAIHDIAGGDGAIVQDNGRKSRKYPLTVYISGVDYDKTADAFASALDETYTPDNPGKLQHPRWGLLDVCPLSYNHTEKLVDDTMLATFQIDFIHAPKLSISSSTTTSAAIQSASDTIASANIADKTATLAADVAKLKKTIKATAKKWTAGLKSITGMTDELRTEITSLGTTIESAVDTLITAPLDLCDSLVSLARLPSQLGTAINSKVSAYSALIDATIERFTLSTSDEIPTTEAQAAIASVSLIALASAALESVSAGNLASRDDAVSAAEYLASIIAAVRAELDALLSLYETPPELLDEFAALSASVQGYLLNESFALRIEHRKTLDADAFPLQLLRDLYGEMDDIDATLDEFIDRNHLGGNSLLVIPRGTEVRYYVQ